MVFYTGKRPLSLIVFYCMRWGNLPRPQIRIFAREICPMPTGLNGRFPRAGNSTHMGIIHAIVCYGFR